MELQKCLKFGTLVVLFDPLNIWKYFYNLIIITEKISLYIFYGEAIKCTCCYGPSQTCVIIKLHTSIFYLISVNI